jgi:hypothetical protein
MHMIDMARSPQEIQESMVPSYEPPLYPYGLCISLTHEDLEKLNLSDDCEVGDMIHLMAMAEVTSVSKNKSVNGGDSCRIELQITHLALEDEELEDPREERKRQLGHRLRPEHLYR